MAVGVGGVVVALVEVARESRARSHASRFDGGSWPSSRAYSALAVVVPLAVGGEGGKSSGRFLVVCVAVCVVVMVNMACRSPAGSGRSKGSEKNAGERSIEQSSSFRSASLSMTAITTTMCVSRKEKYGTSTMLGYAMLGRYAMLGL